MNLRRIPAQGPGMGRVTSDIVFTPVRPSFTLAHRLPELLVGRICPFESQTDQPEARWRHDLESCGRPEGKSTVRHSLTRGRERIFGVSLD